MADISNSELVCAGALVDTLRTSVCQTIRRNASAHRLLEILATLRGSSDLGNQDVPRRGAVHGIVGSTRRQAAVGDRAWRELGLSYHAIAREALARWEGSEHDTTRDGFFASFAGPARAIDWAHERSRSLPHKPSKTSSLVAAPTLCGATSKSQECEGDNAPAHAGPLRWLSVKLVGLLGVYARQGSPARAARRADSRIRSP
jgi:hypothetical protein